MAGHFASFCPAATQQRRPRCFSVVSESEAEAAVSPVVLITLPVPAAAARRIRHASPWNIVRSGQSVTELLGGVAVTRVSLAREQSRALHSLATHVLGRDLDTNTGEPPEIYEVCFTVSTWSLQGDNHIINYFRMLPLVFLFSATTILITTSKECSRVSLPKFTSR